MKRLTTSTLLLALVSILGQTAAAHTRSESYSHWHVSDNRITAAVTTPLREVMILYESGDASIPARELFQQHLLDNTNVIGAGEICPQTGSNILQAASGFIRVELQFDCADAAPDTIEYRAMFDQVPAHVHYAKLHIGGSLVGEALLTDSADSKPSPVAVLIFR